MTDAPAKSRTKRGGLYVTDAEIFEALGFCEEVGRRLTREWEKKRAAGRSYPPKEFGDKRFWPAVLQWHLDYHGVRPAAQSGDAVTLQPKSWEENFDAPAPREARGTERARTRMAPT